MKGELIRREDLTATEREAMFELRRACCRDACRATFDADLAARNWVILLRDGSGAVKGFSTLRAGPSAAAGADALVIYSGDTAVERSAWGSTALPRTWISAVRQLATAYGAARTYWLMVTCGFRTYRFMPVFCRQFHPAYDRPTPAPIKRLIDAVASELLGDQYDPLTGIVRFRRPQPLRPELGAIPPGRLADPHIAHFARRNPGHADGDELLCFAEVAEQNCTQAGWRILNAAPRNGCAAARTQVAEGSPPP